MQTRVFRPLITEGARGKKRLKAITEELNQRDPGTYAENTINHLTWYSTNYNESLCFLLTHTELKDKLVHLA